MVLEWEEWTPIVDTYADGIADVERVGGTNVRQIFFAWQRGTNGIMRRICVAKVVRPIDSVMDFRGRLREIGAEPGPGAVPALGKH